MDAVDRLAGVTVLLVEDSYDTRESLRILLKQNGAAVVAVPSAKDAWAQFTVAPPDVVLCDLALPDEDGFSLLSKMRALAPEQGGRVPAAAVSAYATPEFRERATAAGFAAFLPKPVDFDRLVTVVRQLVEADPSRGG
jgi:CheY-like chemotaxis protein